MKTDNKSTTYPELLEALKSIRQHFIYAGIFSAAINLLMLVPIMYMLQVYDRVISSGSYSTLAMLTLLMVFLLMSMGGFEWVRSMILISASNRLEKRLQSRVFNATFKSAVSSGGAVNNGQPLTDLSSLRQFMTGNGLFAFFDAPWFPIYVALMFVFHPLFGLVALFASVVMIIMAWVNEKITTKKLKDANSQAAVVHNSVIGSLRNAEVIAAMGMTADIRKKQEEQSEEVQKLQTEASRSSGILTSTSKTFRMIVQSLILGLGALLALRQEISPGLMIAGSLLLGRALAPIDVLVGSWKGFSVARAQYERLGKLLNDVPADSEPMPLPPPIGALEVREVSVVPPGTKTPVVVGVSIQLNAGESLGIVGPSASGKSTLARAILGIWPTATGKVRLDGADITNWDRTLLGPYIGYLPQDIELFDGTVSDNICRFGKPDPIKTVAAAKMAGVHEMILKLPKGYDTVISGAGVLSGGQRQRIGLARAVYGSPKLIVLDEPNSNLDEQGERELAAALIRIKEMGCTVVVITHRTMVLNSVDKMLVMKEGTVASFGPRDRVLASLLGKA